MDLKEKSVAFYAKQESKIQKENIQLILQRQVFMVFIKIIH